ncbi:MAG: fused signal recognition particle receptor [Actinomycetota bacterium]|jgi:fused signal recognition particle receptor|nr:fused signal recognition particle receptor [Actinomycetota bacterium]
MELVLVLVVILVLGLAAVGATVATSRRSQRRRDVAERAAVDRAVTEPRPKAEPKAKPGPTAKPKGEPPPGPADIEIVLPSGDDLVLEPDAGIPPEEPVVEAPGVAAPAEPPPPAVRPRLRDRLGKARALLAGYFGDLRSRSVIDDEVWDDLEEALIRADVGVTVTAQILDDLRRRVKEAAVSTPSELLDLLKADLVESMRAADRSLAFSPGQPNVWMFVGVNGVGKTTSIGKIAQREAASGRKVVMAAADTFRAAAAEQLQLWSQRVGADLVRGQDGADPGSVVFDAMAAAGNRGADLVLVDTAGRLHTKVNLMEELKKLRRIVDRTPGALKEVLLVIDASTGQNGLNQAKIFGEAVEVTGVILTKLDGTAKGGIVLAVQQELGIPVKLVGVGESAEDLIDFDPEEFVEALFAA